MCVISFLLLLHLLTVVATCLVIELDTGLNVLGWSLARAAACLRDSGFMSEPEIASELLRYAADDPGQALGYHVGHWYLRELRGTQDIRQFHDAVLAGGPMPLRLLQAGAGRLPSL